MVAIPSIRGEAEEGAPFGKGPRQALDEVLAIARELGFRDKRRNIDNKIGYAQQCMKTGPDGAYYGIFWTRGCDAAWRRMDFSALALTARDGRPTGNIDNKGPVYRTLRIQAQKRKGVTLIGWFDWPWNE